MVAQKARAEVKRIFLLPSALSIAAFLGQTNAFATNHPASPSKSAFADAVDLPKDSIDPTSRIVDDKDGSFA